VEFTFADINDAYCTIVGMFKDFINNGSPKTHSYLKRSTSRNGDVIRFKEPVTIHYLLPSERVLLSPDRNENPFFHLYEALWMLNGENSVKPLTALNSNMINYSDDGRTFNGAYGRRWRRAIINENSPFEKEVDQLYLIIEHLKRQKDSRRAVLQMWNVSEDLLKIEGVTGYCNYDDFKSFSRDVCCNTACFFDVDEDVLNMSITNRSNDAIWGLLGANYVHFSFLQEYVAAHLGVKLGRMTVFSNNVHTYVDKFNVNWDVEYVKEITSLRLLYNNLENLQNWQGDLTKNKNCFRSFGLNQQVNDFDFDLPNFVAHFDLSTRNIGFLEDIKQLEGKDWNHSFLQEVAKPLLLVFFFHKNGYYAKAAYWLEKIIHYEWQRAAMRWIRQRWLANGCIEALEALDYLRTNTNFNTLEKDLSK